MTSLAIVNSAPAITPEQLDLIRKTVANGATADELKLYLYDCQRQGVHPLDKLIHFTKRKGKYTPVTSIDFMRIQAANTGECLGISDPIFAMDATKITAATVTVKRLVQGQVAEFTATARMSEYRPSDEAFMWQKMPHTMLGKCAEALALRKGFPKQLSGLYASEEMDQASESKSVQIPAAPLVPMVEAGAPKGYEDWVIQLEEAAEGGIESMLAVFRSGSREMKLHRTQYDNARHESLKAKAEDVRTSA